MLGQRDVWGCLPVRKQEQVKELLKEWKAKARQPQMRCAMHLASMSQCRLLGSLFEAMFSNAVKDIPEKLQSRYCEEHAAVNRRVALLVVARGVEHSCELGTHGCGRIAGSS